MLTNGNIVFLRRKDTQVMILGKRVEPDGVESVLCNCPEVKQGIVSPYMMPEFFVKLSDMPFTPNGSV